MLQTDPCHFVVGVLYERSTHYVWEEAPEEKTKYVISPLSETMKLLVYIKLYSLACKIDMLIHGVLNLCNCVLPPNPVGTDFEKIQSLHPMSFLCG